MKIYHHLLIASLGLFSLRAAETESTASARVTLAFPQDYQVTQRDSKASGKLIIAGDAVTIKSDAPPLDALEAQIAGKSLAGEFTSPWQPLPYDARVPHFKGGIDAPAGWYRLTVRGLVKGQQVCKTVVEHVGVGEIFVIAGQSNAANHGEEKQKIRSGLVAAYDGQSWAPANDPQPGASGNMGSFIPAFGDLMAEHFQVPIGIVATAQGGTSVREWLAPGTRISPLPTVTQNITTVGAEQWEATGNIYASFTTKMKIFGRRGFRAVLWHQGESDAHQALADRTLPGSAYQQYLAQLIQDSRHEIGWDAPWFVAQVSYHVPGDTSSPDIRNAQKALSDAGIALAGPDTDTLTGGMRDNNGQGIHLSGPGLREHGKLWAEKVIPWLDHQLENAAR